MAIEISRKVTFNAATAVEIDFGELVFSYDIYSEDNVFHVQEDATDAWDLLTAAQKKAATYRVPVNVIRETVIPCRKISIIGESGGGVVEVKAVPLQSNAAIPDIEVYEYRAVNPAMR